MGGVGGEELELGRRCGLNKQVRWVKHSIAVIIFWFGRLGVHEYQKGNALCFFVALCCCCCSLSF